MLRYVNFASRQKPKLLRTLDKSPTPEFLRCQRGNMSLMAAGALGVIVLAVGAALDTSMATSTRAQAQATLDSAVLASAVDRTERINSEAESNSLGELHFTSHFDPPHPDTTISGVDITFDGTTNQTSGTARVKYQTMLMGIFGRPEMDISVTSKAVSPAGKPIDVSLMLDVSGSMAGERLEGLKTAVGSFLDIVIGHGNVSEDARVALVPFSTSINAGPYVGLMKSQSQSNQAITIGYNPTSGSNGTPCVGERNGPYAFTDNRSLSVSMFDVDGAFGISNDENNSVYREGYFRGYPSSPGLDEFGSETICSDSELVPLTGDYDLLSDKLDDLDAQGLTAGHLGIAYSWYMISEKWRPFWPNGRRPGLNSETDKIVILMTDGQFNTYYEAGNGLPNVQGQQLCDNMKAANVTIYAISFDTEGDSSDLLRDCASAPQNYFSTDTISGLSDAFQNIANQLKDSDIYLSR